jgi:tripartite-type tricarboxylate transporter receptor subunit TctC
MKANSPVRGRIAAALIAVLTPLAAHATGPGGFPSGPVTIVVPFVPGGATDVVGRQLADALTQRWGQAVVVENRAGASGVSGTAYVAKAKADGRTLLLGTQTALAVTPLLLKTMPYDVAKDFTPISLLVTTPLVLLASEKSGVTSAADLVKTMKAQPGKLSYGTSGIGTSQHLTTLLFLNRVGAEAVHIPYKGTGQFLTDMAGGQIDFGFDNMGTAVAIAKQGRAKALAITGLTRSALEPSLPTLAESGVPGFEAVTWLGLLAPAGLPEPVAAYINHEIVAVLADPAFDKKLVAQGFTPRPMQMQEFRDYIRAETDRFAALIKKNGVAIE